MHHTFGWLSIFNWFRFDRLTNEEKKKKKCVPFSKSLCLFSGLVMLLQDPDPLVRVKAAEAMGHFH